MAEPTARLEALESEMRLLKGEIKKTLVDLRAVVMKAEGPLGEGATLVMNANRSAETETRMERRMEAMEGANRESREIADRASRVASQAAQAVPAAPLSQGSGGPGYSNPPVDYQPPGMRLEGRPAWSPSYDSPNAAPQESRARVPMAPQDEELEAPPPRSALPGQEGGPSGRSRRRVQDAERGSEQGLPLPARSATATTPRGRVRDEERMQPRMTARLPMTGNSGNGSKAARPHDSQPKSGLRGRPAERETVVMMSRQEQLSPLTGEMAGTLSVNLLSNLVHWVSRAKQRVGEEKLLPLVDLFLATGVPAMGLRDLVAHISAMVGTQGVDETQEQPKPSAQDWIDLMLQLHGIVMGSDIVSDAIAGWENGDADQNS